MIGPSTEEDPSPALPLGNEMETVMTIERITSYDLRSAKVGDEVCYAKSRNSSQNNISKVVKVTTRKAVFGTEVSNVWLEDGSRWTGKGYQYGEQSTWGKVSAYVILNRPAYDLRATKAKIQEVLNRRRERVTSIDRDQVSRMTDEEVSAINAILVQVQMRRSAYIFGKFAQNLFAPSCY